MMKRKIVDAHAHAFIGRAATGTLGVPYEQIELIDRSEILLREMDKYGAEAAILHVSHTRRESELHQSTVRKYPGRFVGFCRWGTGVTGREAA